MNRFTLCAWRHVTMLHVIYKYIILFVLIVTYYNTGDYVSKAWKLGICSHNEAKCGLPPQDIWMLVSKLFLHPSVKHDSSLRIY
jgi:hypothetical protein